MQGSICSWFPGAAVPRQAAATGSGALTRPPLPCRPAQHAGAPSDTLAAVPRRHSDATLQQRGSLVAAASMASAVGEGSVAAASADAQDSQKTARAAQRLVAEASKANEADASHDTRQGLVRD